MSIDISGSSFAGIQAGISNSSSPRGTPMAITSIIASVT